MIHFRESPELTGRLFPLLTEGYDTGDGIRRVFKSRFGQHLDCYPVTIIRVDRHKDENPKVLTKLLSSCWIEVGDTVQCPFVLTYMKF